MIISYTAREEDKGRKVYSILRFEMKASAALTRRLKAAGAIYVSGVPVFTDYRVTPGETVSADIGAAEQPCDNVPEQGEIEILFENEGLLAVNKPPGLIVHPTRSRNEGTLSNFVAGYLSGSGGVCHAVNRLDRDTSGIVLFAKNSYMKARASEALSDKSAIKEYMAIVQGIMPESGVIEAPIRRLGERNMLRVVSPDGQKAVTQYGTINVCRLREYEASLVRMRLETGRTHQIRVHCLHLGRPVLGDMLYGTEESRAASRAFGITKQALHAHKLAFTEPLSCEYLEITAAPPENFACFLQKDMLTFIGASPRRDSR